MMKKVMLGCMVSVCLVLVFATVLGESSLSSGQALRSELPYRLGDRGEVIRDIKEALFAIRGNHELMQNPDAGDGEAFSAEYDKPLHEAVLRYQKKQKLPETGVVDDEMMNLLLPRYYDRIDAREAGALVLGTISEKVKNMQKDLKRLGYYQGDITGHVGEITERAVMAFQEAHGMKVNGFADEETLEAIRTEADSGR